MPGRFARPAQPRVVKTIPCAGPLPPNRGYGTAALALAACSSGSTTSPDIGCPVIRYLKGTMKRYVAILAVLLCATGRSGGAEEPRVVELWPGKAPEEP